MARINLLFANRTYDTAKQSVEKNQIIRMNGYEDDGYAVYDITYRSSGLIYRLINLRTHKFGQCDLIRPLSEKFGIGYYYDDENPEFMDAFEVDILRSEAEQTDRQEQEELQKRQEHGEQLKVAGRKRLATLVPADAKAVIVAELHENESDPMTDYFGYRTQRTVIPGFSTHTKDLFSEMRRYAANFSETAHLAAENPDSEIPASDMLYFPFVVFVYCFHNQAHKVRGFAAQVGQIYRNFIARSVCRAAGMQKIRHFHA
jgi:hypothetical protein